MHRYIAELDSESQIAAVWVENKKTRKMKVFDPKKHFFDPQEPNEFLCAPQSEIVKWLTEKSLKN
ncbi:hypothetical protein NIG5292_02164 [Nereida ignava]|uniref:Uncharacterized protein n=1 Tax=Nereida ignava TaxID=282199 RepID=A0A0U1NN34_9RHOB|nr:hypothetical protein [Nereida ignava]CRK76107.1 hypothetical protein NIG5292_02164 [Nereida ignava]SFJ85203.1 hypothetical protein SAMN02745667_02586 [Nereida ignava DSM 16309]